MCRCMDIEYEAVTEELAGNIKAVEEQVSPKPFIAPTVLIKTELQESHQLDRRKHVNLTKETQAEPRKLYLLLQFRQARKQRLCCMQ